ncbi:Golgi phosphoprotein 3-domain-containing protein [Mycena rebaudengoi]|nr:Golgi phosphoprotein 3-domain-containing protein [Mycena rebaudengoi]
MASSGLSRRRANAPTTTTHDDDDNAPSSPPASSTPAEKSPEAQLESLGLTGGAHAGSAFANGSRVAYDPRDLLLSSQESAALGGSVPKLTLMEEVLLLGIKDKQGYLSFWNDNISYALRGCILMELALRRRIGIVRDPMSRRTPLTERPVTVLSTRQTGETLLDETLKMMKQTEDSGERMGVATWVDLLSGKCRVPIFIFPPFSSSSLHVRLSLLGFGGAIASRVYCPLLSSQRGPTVPRGLIASCVVAHYDTLAGGGSSCLMRMPIPFPASTSSGAYPARTALPACVRPRSYAHSYTAHAQTRRLFDDCAALSAYVRSLGEGGWAA